MPRPLALAAVLALLGAVAAAQSLGEAAARERERRARRGPVNARVYTDEDLKSAEENGSDAKKATSKAAGDERQAQATPPEAAPPPSRGEDEGSASSPSAASAEEDSEDAEAILGGDEAAWRARARERRQVVATLESRVEQLQAQLNGLMTDRDPRALMDPYRLQTIEAQKRETQQQLDQTRLELAEARKALDDLEAEARRNQIPPGWLREP